MSALSSPVLEARVDELASSVCTALGDRFT